MDNLKSASKLYEIINLSISTFSINSKVKGQNRLFNSLFSTFAIVNSINSLHPELQ